MDTLRPRLDLLAFTLALALVAWLAIGFVAERNGAAAIMCAMCLTGLVAGRIVGVPGRLLFDTALVPSKRDSAEDILFGTAGGLAGIMADGVVAFWRRG